MKKKNDSNQERPNVLPKSFLLNYKNEHLPDESSKALQTIFSDLDFELEDITNTSERALLDYLIENYLWKQPSPAVNLSETVLIYNIEKMTGGIFADAIKGLRRAIYEKNLSNVAALDHFVMNEEPHYGDTVAGQKQTAIPAIKGNQDKDSTVALEAAAKVGTTLGTKRVE